MTFVSPFLITFIMVFLSELGDKTQLLVLSFANKLKTIPILVGVAIGTFFSHGIAILFGSRLGLLNPHFQLYISIFTYLTFILFGVLGFLPKQESSDDKKSGLLSRISRFSMNYVFMIAISIVVGEIGDKTFLASLGLGFEYPNAKVSLILGSIFGMVLSNLIAIFFGKFLGTKLKQGTIEKLSNWIFILFGVLGFLKLVFSYLA